MNKIVVIGHLGRDPEMRYTLNGQAVTSFSIASSRKYTTGVGEQREETEWFNCQAWGKLALGQVLVARLGQPRRSKMAPAAIGIAHNIFVDWYNNLRGKDL